MNKPTKNKPQLTCLREWNYCCSSNNQENQANQINQGSDKNKNKVEKA